MHSSLLANLLLLLSVFHLVAAASEEAVPAANIEARQNPAARLPECLDYEWTANMSTIGANGSYRTVLLQKSNVGTIYNARMMDAAIKKLPKLTADRELNAKCSNWTAIALREAAANYSNGIVAQFTTEGLPVGIKAGPIVVIVVGLISIMFSVVWVFSP